MQTGSGFVGEPQQQELWAALQKHGDGRSVELGVSAVHRGRSEVERKGEGKEGNH